MTRADVLKRREWRDLFDALPVLAKFFGGDPASHGINALVRGIVAYLETMAARLDQGTPVVWYNLGFESELLHALGDVHPMPIELLGALHSCLGDGQHTLDFIDEAQGAGVPADCCSADKIAIGAIRRGLLPAPVCTVGINTPCDAQVLSTQVMQELSRVPFFAVDVPYYHDETTIRHVAAQLAELVPFLEEHTGRRMDYDRLRAACELSNRTSENLWSWLDWRKQVPLTQSSKLVGFLILLQMLFSGSPAGVEISEAFLREARERTERGERFFEERVRAVWYQDAVWTDLQIYDWFERELGLTVPVDIFGYYANAGVIDTRTPETMLYGLARKLVDCHPMARQFRGDIDFYIDDFMRLVEMFNADCCIFAGHIACKHAWGGIGLFKEACRRAGIPVLVFEFDMFDPRVTPYDDVYFAVERFVNEVVVPLKARTRALPAPARREAAS
jgi:benzoyl-CoA reductase/2-hydroxyglutaryl-CoA dehydratase subunit BcrC/BadD/HgdB